jgi:hypothetical protein
MGLSGICLGEIIHQALSNTNLSDIDLSGTMVSDIGSMTHVLMT